MKRMNPALFLQREGMLEDLYIQDCLFKGFQEGAYWNLDTTALEPGFVKSNVYAEGDLHIEDEGLRNMVYNQLKANEAFSDVVILRNEVNYIWGE